MARRRRVRESNPAVRHPLLWPTTTVRCTATVDPKWKFKASKLGSLVEYANVLVVERYHRALADAEMAASLLAKLIAELRNRYELSEVSHELLCKIQRTLKRQIDRCIQQHQREGSIAP